MSVEQRIAEIEKLLSSSDESKRKEAKRLYEEFRKQHGGAYIPDIDAPTCPTGQYYDTALQKCVPDTPPGCPELPADGRPQPQKNANKDPNTWKVVAMTDDPSLFKVVDSANVNVADQFHAQATADQYIAHYKCTPPPVECPPGQHPDANGNCVPDDTPPPPPPPPGGQLGPYASTGKELGATTRRATRHYASGKSDDETVEKNTKSIPYANYQCIYYVTMHDIEHDDNVSSKLGGTHMGSGWLDHGVSFNSGKTCLGTEPNHPNTNSCIKVGANIGSIIEKRTGIATVYRKATNYTELWTNTGSGWVKQLDATDLGGFKPNNSDDDEAQLRIDGFTDGSDPTIDVAVVQEIAASGTTPPPPPPPPPTEPCPPGQHRDQNGICVPDITPPPPPPPSGDVRKIYESIGQPVTGQFSSSNAGRFQWKFDLPKCMINQEATAYLKIAKVDDDGEEVSLKLRGGNHSSNDSSTGSCYIIGINYNGGVNSQFESPHPNNHPMSSTVVTPNPLGNSVVGKSFGIKGIVFQQGDHDHIECWIDKGGLVNGKPANDWVKFWQTDSKQFFGKCNGKGQEKALIRLDEIPGGDNQENVEIAFQSVVEIKPPTTA